MSAGTGHGRNPYRPGAAIRPLFLAGRDAEQRRFRAVLDASPQLPANVRITGLRGVGKSVLLKRLDELAGDGNWLTSRMQVEPRHNRDATLLEATVGLASQAQLRASRAERVRKRLRDVARHTRTLQVTWEDLSFSIDPLAGDRTTSLAKALYDATNAAVEADFAGYLLMLDEAQVLRDETDRNGQHPLSALIVAINTLQEQELPIGIVLCGLPSLSSNLLRARTYTERMFRGEQIGALSRADAADALLRPAEGTSIAIDADVVDRVVDEVEGYPFFIQLWGAELWEAARDATLTNITPALLDAVEPEIYRRLDADFYDNRVDVLTPAEQDLLMATAGCPYPPLTSADIRRRSGKTDANVNVLMGRLSDQGVVYRIQRGQYDYTAPKFHEFLQRRAGRQR
ncbi:MAG: hypothetical protein DLM61_10000 [Pseudonocardiales bacterium]|nr:MAG: hypothetical protein DLM61_10000 [Pseudonocardiales bacterium]